MAFPLGAVLTIGQAVVGKIAGDAARTSCANQAPVDAVERMLRNAPQPDLLELRRLYLLVHPTRSWPQPAAELAFAAAGGSDCQATSSNGRAFASFFNDLVVRFGGASSMQPIAGLGYSTGEAQLGGVQQGTAASSSGNSSRWIFYAIAGAALLLGAIALLRRR